VIDGRAGEDQEGGAKRTPELGLANDRDKASEFWEDNDQGALEHQLTDILVTMLVGAETSYRNSLVWHREWIIERKASAEAELKRRKEEDRETRLRLTSL